MTTTAKPKPLWALVKAICPECGHDGVPHYRLDGRSVCERVVGDSTCTCSFDYLTWIGWVFVPVT